jgi:CDGSH-type Zn-finger protein/truncated hemoglobin YjbI/ferredoxin
VTIDRTPDASSDAVRKLLASARSLLASIGVDTAAPDGARALANVADTLKASVIRPLAAMLGDEGAATSADFDTGQTLGDPNAALWDLALRATALCAAPDRTPALMEGAAALQRLIVAFDGGEADARTAELRALLHGQAPSIRIAHNGPLLALNVGDIHDWLGRPFPVRPLAALCRCGASAIKPYCDGSHARVGFDEAKDPARVPDRRDAYAGQQVTIFDNRGTCQHSGFCTDRLSTVFRLKADPFVAPSGGRMDEIIRAVRDCPSGALSYGIDGKEARADVDYHATRAPGIEVSKDGPYRVTGGVDLLDADGKAVAQNAGASLEHVALCRCGHAQNKPFCTGMHWYVEFRDPVPPPDEIPTIFEWAGGLPALTRMTRLFYEKFVPADDLLAPLFANMSPDHPQRVAKWLGEVFGGPTCYSQEYGGYPRMLSQHLDKSLTEPMRARWVALLLQSAHEAGLPNDAEFRSAFQAYIEWGSRLAVENSQPDVKPPQHMPMPHWDWNTSAGPPGSRIPANAPSDETPDAASILPQPGEKVEYAKHIKALFRSRDRTSMRFVFDLWSYADVSVHADGILKRLRDGSMPCDGAWPQERIDVFARWLAAGKPE